ncbi:hypothetical protein HWD31_gp21 [Pantoea phage vB_PagM_SSEM1]|uniref:Uncharacterized protein n=1 Tax=Pantoea phage vB_PagM_SSEM1 TaxID=2721760 RepID=A0A6H0D9J8_9CAUD|nr:hypothetical protein HWD31_gp21 [Pantoea phage vB_PagM_SSEM1]QIS79386.1 hypothetical protein SSEM1_gp21 [Pantoea phage vB_PagM_SSEM1]
MKVIPPAIAAIMWISALVFCYIQGWK